MYMCPSCGAGLKFSIPDQQLKCAHCDSLFSMKWAAGKSANTEEFETNVFQCSQCGGEIYTLDNDITGRCSFCGSDMTFQNRISQMNPPKKIIPFKKTKEDCKEAYLKKARHAFFAPGELKKKEFIDGFRGIYMPYWIYELQQNTDIIIEGTKSYSKGDYDYTDYYQLSGHLHSVYPDVLHDASSSFSDDISEKIEPFYMNQDVVDFEPAYLSGFYGEMDDVDAGEYIPYVWEVVAEDTYEFIKTEWSDLSIKKPDAEVYGTTCPKTEIGLLPVWFLSYRNKNRVMYATVNGQTGKVSAEFPIDMVKYWFFTVFLAIPIYFLFNLIFAFRPPVLACISSIIALIVMSIYKSDLKVLIRKNSEMLEKQNRVQLTEEEKKMIHVSRVDQEINLFWILLGILIAMPILILLFSLVFEVSIGSIVEVLLSNLALKFYMLPLAGMGWYQYSDCNSYYKLGKRLNMNIHKGYVYVFAAVLIAAGLEFVAPVSDLIYYGICACSLFAIIMTLIDLIFCHNLITTRELPQFRHKGGDDGVTD